MKVKRAMSVIQAGLSRALKSDVHGHCHETREREVDITDAIGISHQYLNNMTNAHHGIAMDIAVALCRALGRHEIAREFCRLVGGHFVLHVAETPVLAMVRECSEAWDAVAASYRDGVITEAERVKCERQLDDAIEAALAVKARLRLDRDVHRNGDRVARLGDVRE